MQFGNFPSRDERDCCPECTALQSPPGEQCIRCGRTASDRVADWSDYIYVVGNAVNREALFDRLLTVYDRILLQFGMHISWQPRQPGNNLPLVQRLEEDK